MKPLVYVVWCHNMTTNSADILHRL
jgi:hypothetical protein